MGYELVENGVHDYVEPLLPALTRCTCALASAGTSTGLRCSNGCLAFGAWLGRVQSCRRSTWRRVGGSLRGDAWAAGEGGSKKMLEYVDKKPLYDAA